MISGDEFLMPLQAFFCSLCCEFSKDSISAEAHLKSRDHNNKFKVRRCQAALVSLGVVIGFSVRCLDGSIFTFFSENHKAHYK